MRLIMAQAAKHPHRKLADIAKFGCGFAAVQHRCNQIFPVAIRGKDGSSDMQKEQRQ
jgi:hypothetical protein